MSLLCLLPEQQKLLQFYDRHFFSVSMERQLGDRRPYDTTVPLTFATLIPQQRSIMPVGDVHAAMQSSG